MAMVLSRLWQRSPPQVFSAASGVDAGQGRHSSCGSVGFQKAGAGKYPSDLRREGALYLKSAGDVG